MGNNARRADHGSAVTIGDRDVTGTWRYRRPALTSCRIPNRTRADPPA